VIDIRYFMNYRINVKGRADTKTPAGEGGRWKL